MTTAAAFDALRSTLDAHWQGLPDKPEETPEATARALWFAAAGAPRSVIAAADGTLPTLDDAAAGRLRALIERRVAGEPLAHLTGRQRFMGLELLSEPGALIPRVETEILAGETIAAARAAVAERGAVTVIDVCTGSGNVALAVAAHVPEARVHAADLSADAVALARRNAAHLGLADRVTFAAGDLFAPIAETGFTGQADVISCNPPYISSANVPKMAAEISRHEPSLAFDGGAMGFTIITRTFAEAPPLLRAGGTLCVEVGAGQGAFIAKRMARNETWSQVRTADDAQGQPRVVVAVKGQ